MTKAIPQTINGWEVIPHRVMRSAEGHTVSRFSAIPGRGTNEKIVDTGRWTLMNLNTSQTLMRVPFETMDEAVEYATNNRANTVGYGD